MKGHSFRLLDSGDGIVFGFRGWKCGFIAPGCAAAVEKIGNGCEDGETYGNADADADAEFG